MADTKISQLTEATSISNSDYFVIDNGSETRKVNSSKLAFSFVGMVVQGTNLTTEASVKALYGSDTTWQLISSVALASEHIVGNGYNLALTNGTNLVALNTTGGLNKQGISYGVKYPTMTGGSGSDITSSQGIGVPTKALLGNNLEYSGIVADTITVYSWERTV